MDITKMLNLPIVASAHGHEIDMMIYLVHILMVILGLGWGVYFVVVLWRFRRRKNVGANYQGTQSHASSAIEVAVIIAEAILLIGFSIPFWAKQVNAFPQRKDIIEVRVVAEQFAWNIHYPGADGIFGKTDIKFFDKQSNPLGLDPNDPHGKDDITTINQLHLPIGRPAVIYLTSRDVMHSFSLPVMRVKQDVIPGMSIPTWFTPTRTGAYEIGCAQLCGLGHYRMKGFLTIHTQEEFDQWLKDQASSSQKEEGTDDFWGS
ncbi:MAG: cytochrome c oxidase subunit II [Candidatus Omnitrophica bacterium]|nr:cytochrome c oxidase subunit II [Candidatus Omnitrophota bacterium]